MSKIVNKRDGFIPRWRKVSTNVHTYCQIPMCNSAVYKVTKVASTSDILKVFGVSDENTDCNENEGTALCVEHYGGFYKHLNPNKRCVTCGRWLTDTTKIRKCPDPRAIQTFLQQNAEFNGKINNGDYVCYTCYREHCVIIKHLQNTVNSTDVDLSATLDKIKEEMAHIMSTLYTMDQVLLYASHSCALRVGDALLQQTVLLLPDVFDYFCEKSNEIMKQHDIVFKQDITTIATPRWLRSQLSALLEHHMAYRCSVKRYGTLLYRYGGDLVHALSVSLGQMRNKPHNQGRGETEHSEFQMNLKQTCEVLNDKIHKCINKLVQQDSASPHSIEDINIDKFISEMDQDIWTAVCTLTKPLSTRPDNRSTIRKIRRFFCVCILLFTTNRRCSFPLHTFLTDAIETCGGSSRLVRLLNRLGVCASADTHSRYVLYRVQATINDGPLSGYPMHALTLVSLDNLDYVHSFARVFCGLQQSSWHGTTVQFVQPQPLSLHVVHSTTCNRQVSQSDIPSAQHLDALPATGTPHTETTHRLNSRPASKRSYSTLTPVNSPSKRSPLPKKQRRMRTGMEGIDTNTSTNISVSSRPLPQRDDCCLQPELQNCTLKLDDFRISDEEKKVLLDLKTLLTHYMLQKMANNDQSETIIDLKTYLTLYHNVSTQESSNIIYYKVLEQRCDDKATLLGIISELYEEFVVPNKMKWLVLEGDQATYDRLQSIKREYGKDLSWMIPFPGDWHFLKNFQDVIMKVYFDAGLSDIAKASGYQTNAIGSNFKRNHNFLLEAWESLYRYFLSLFLSNKAPTDFLEFVKGWVRSFPTSQDQQNAHRNLKQLMVDVLDKYERFPEEFLLFMEEQAQNNKTWRFWKQFVLEDCLAYVSLYLAMRSGSWDLRVTAIKSMAALFTAFDRPNYSKLIPQHIRDMLTVPKELISLLSKGGFVVSIQGRPCRSVGVDEAHEMCINRECKEYITRPSADYINRIAKFLPIRAKAMKNVEPQLFPEHNTKKQTIKSIHTKDKATMKFAMNVQRQIQKLSTDSTIRVSDDSTSNTLCHLFKKKSTSTEQDHDLTNFRKIGQAEFERTIEYYILRKPSVQPPKHRKNLLTFTERKSRRKRVSDVERERKLQIECWKKRVAFAHSTGTHIQHTYQQCIELPRALATSDGNPTKGTKANSTKVYEKRYESVSPPIFRTSLPQTWTPDAVIIEGMFLINVVPWSAHKTFGDYGDFLIRQHIQSHFRNGATEVHLLFDDPESQVQSPKFFERKCRDLMNPIPDGHCCHEFAEDMIIPPKWRVNVLNCRKCKRNLVSFLSQYFVDKMKRKLLTQQKFVTAGGFSGTLQDQAVYVKSSGPPQRDDMLKCNAEETDTRVWLHVVHSAGQKKLVLSPDTDVYHIGLPYIAGSNLDVMVKLSPLSSLQLRLLDMQALVAAVNNDPELSVIPQPLRPSVLQILYICSGCDFISFFHGYGKASFLAALFEYCEFICSNSSHTPGVLTDTLNDSQGFLSFIRLVGCAYYRKHKSAFLPSYTTPMIVFNSLITEGQTPLEHHTLWLDFIRERVWSKIQYEEDMIPSITALARHWRRTCWVETVWKQATQNHIEYPPLHGNGWKQTDYCTLVVDWDSEANIQQVRTMVALIKRGCGCKTGCTTARCKCKKAGVHCGPGCKCLRCSNLPVSSNLDMLNVEVEEMNDGVSDSDDDNLEEDVNNVMYEVFGSDDEIDSNASDILSDIEVDIHYTTDSDIDEEFM